MRQEIEELLSFVQKPGRYSGGEPGSVVKNPSDVDVRFAFCFPDTYEIGMSHLGMKILYSLLNKRGDTWCERVFAPWIDMRQLMEERGVPLFALESGDFVSDFDFIGFTLQYELCYTNVLDMLSLAGIPLRSRYRTGLSQIVIAGGPCTCNPEPVADFFDIIVLGEGEEVIGELIDVYKKYKQIGGERQDFLVEAAGIDGVYVPSLYDVSYNVDGTVKNIAPQKSAPAKITKRIIKDLDSVYYPESFVVPFIEIVHDRVSSEIFRGCARGCRFCQAGFIYRPVREKSAGTVDRQSRTLCESTGYDEISLTSLSTSDYTGLPELLPRLIDWTEDGRVNLSLPSMRIDNFSDELAEQLQRVRRSGLTFAPEAGTGRLRDAINKNITEDEILAACRRAFASGWTAVKLYFMLGLPTETPEDIEGIALLAQKIVDEFYAAPGRAKGKSVQISVSAASFVPKPFTPFQWEPQDGMEALAQKQRLLLESIKSKKISVSYHDVRTSFLEAVFARGDRRLSDVIESAWRGGCRFDSWDDQFLFDVWLKAFDTHSIGPAFYACRRREFDELLPWDHLDYGIDKGFLIRENERAHKNLVTKDCREGCGGCGADRFAPCPVGAIIDRPHGNHPAPSGHPSTGGENPSGNQPQNMPIIRLRFTKTGRAAYISHLDVNRFMARILRRAEIPVWYTEGYNPHPYVTFALPLPLGVRSLCESMDIRLERGMPEDEIISWLNAAAPEGITFLSAAPARLKPSAIAYAAYELRFAPPCGIAAGELADEMNSILRRGELLALKQSKKQKKHKHSGPNETEINLLKDTGEWEVKAVDNTICINIELPAGSLPNVNPLSFLSAIAGKLGFEPQNARITRLNILTADKNAFI